MKKVIFLLSLFLVVPFSHAYGSAQDVNYVALGDSLAKGMNPYKTVGKGYSDKLVPLLEQEGRSVAFSKEFAVPGYTTENLLQDLEVNAYSKHENLFHSVENASLITVQAGANDLLHYIAPHRQHMVSLSNSEWESLLQQTQQNMETILERIRDLNPTSDVYVVGYYFPFSNIDNPFQEQNLKQRVFDLNVALQKAASSQEHVYYVSTENLFSQNRQTYLPNKIDIHPSQQGYDLLAQRIFDTIHFSERFLH
ncbi:GDSL-type esterase/lipase family protein [Priestia endophytica]|uniref:GDSL-type esterase/lipase family protein n=1 Tax=Priestia endophytica TaxID=135735 RepID=UPI00124CBC73|nr:GDSL-type esterase/lipase family protein [Priestia endophytica]KAB2494425.1 hypothetical protein F8155_07565 [Priestia endophytica]